MRRKSPGRRSLRRALLALSAGLALASPAWAEIDISGEWGSRLHEDLQHRYDGAEAGDYTGLPLNAAGQRKADSWDASILSSPEEQTKPHPAQYSLRGPGTNLRITKVMDPVTQELVAYTIEGLYGRADRTIWMDGRPHPSEHAEHQWQGFSTGKVVDDKLVVTTTHMKQGVIQRNGAAASFRSTMTEYWVRHGDLMTVTTFIDDPVYLEEPMVRSSTWKLTPGVGVDNRMAFEVVDEVAGRPKDFVPANPLGKHYEEFGKTLGIPFQATQGGSATIYPEYQATLDALIKGQPAPPAPPPPPQKPPPPRPSEVGKPVEVLELRPNLHMLVVDGINVTVQTGKDGVVIVDAGPATASAKLLAAVRALSSGPIRYLINTSGEPESVGANAAVVDAAGGPRHGGAAAGPIQRPPAVGVDVIAQENVSVRMAQQDPAPNPEALPTSTFYTDRKDIFANGEAIELHSEPATRTDSDILVFFRGSDVVAAGGTLDVTRFPIIDTAKGGSLDGVIKALTDIIDIAVPERNQMGGTLIVPGVGRICNESDVVEYRDMMIIIRDRLRDMAARKLTIAQVKAAQPLLEYEGLYGTSTGPWTTDRFLETAYAQIRAAGVKK
jgi:glyoxylase-like metal-dependent hydrolase (beta-lactamase superfamily II)